MRSATFRSTASEAEYAFADSTVASNAEISLPLDSAILRMNAAASSVAFKLKVSGKSSPSTLTTEAAPMLVAGARASIWAAAPIKVPALAAWAPSGAT